MVKPGSAAQHAAKAIEMLRAARLLLEGGMPVRAASDGYYAVFHLAEALLATAGHAAETHAGVHTLLARHFVRDGPLPRDASQRFTHLMGDRLNADYGVDRQIDDAGGRRSVMLAAGLADDIALALGAQLDGETSAALRSAIAGLTDAVGA
jgi:uncharacterized protein (UPF0332 family)